jgi:hypothetical protein
MSQARRSVVRFMMLLESENPTKKWVEMILAHVAGEEDSRGVAASKQR